MASVSDPQNSAAPANSGSVRKPTDGRTPPPYGAPPSSASGRPPRGRGGGPPPPRVKNVPPRPSFPPNHRSSRSQEDDMKSRPPPSGAGAHGDNVASGSSAEASSSRRPSQPTRPRRNSESSVAGDNDKTLSKGDKVLRDVRRREQELRERGAARAISRRNDIIDQMDASSIFGTVFHHDGPFDALNPHRNRKNSRRAPMQAFPKDSLNNVLGGSGPVNKHPDHRTLMGHNDDEAFRDFSGSRPEADKAFSSSRMAVFVDPFQSALPLHGDQSLGLGTSTFLEGTPAARTAIQRREAERSQDYQENSLQRKKSLAQRFRSINRGPREPHAARAFSSDGGSQATRLPAARFSGDANPFDEFDTQKGDDVITVRRKGSAALPSPPSPPRNPGLERRSTTDGTTSSDPSYVAGPADGTALPSPPAGAGGDDSQQRPAGNGLLARVKSLKGGRRPAPLPPTHAPRDS
ncbi:Pal1 cell morphology [Niveomyces insectorum RCEF 264]|uniref:Pal1 cell morphology n=1 Tax=Niveomyces insectorum RCEF 264 TaxID=1081102 RepID=A0A167UJF3_9HYPO|nr:Pal1 cell morphology [Niveomyces insectorum RCEF 264]